MSCTELCKNNYLCSGSKLNRDSETKLLNECAVSRWSPVQPERDCVDDGAAQEHLPARDGALPGGRTVVPHPPPLLQQDQRQEGQPGNVSGAAYKKCIKDQLCRVTYLLVVGLNRINVFHNFAHLLLPNSHRPRQTVETLKICINPTHEQMGHPELI